jgi:hypothetical protein
MREQTATHSEAKGALLLDVAARQCMIIRKMFADEDQSSCGVWGNGWKQFWCRQDVHTMTIKNCFPLLLVALVSQPFTSSNNYFKKMDWT